MAKPKLPEAVVITKPMAYTGPAKEAKKAPVIAGKLFGLTKDPETRFGYTYYFLLTATVDEEGEIISVEKSSQSWFMWEAIHKMERAAELSLIDIQQNKEPVK